MWRHIYYTERAIFHFTYAFNRCQRVYRPLKVYPALVFDAVDDLSSQVHRETERSAKGPAGEAEE